MGNVGNPFTVLELSAVQAAAGVLGLEIVTLEIRHAQDIAPAFEIIKGRSQALYVCTDALANINRIGINILAVGARLPTMHGSRDYVESGGLISLGQTSRTCFGELPTTSTRFCAGLTPPISRWNSRPSSISS
jgi:ABC-type uncharacterized transport system substrate-binding protein